VYFSVLFCLSVSVKWLAVKTVSSPLCRVGRGALHSAATLPVKLLSLLLGELSLYFYCQTLNFLFRHFWKRDSTCGVLTTFSFCLPTFSAIGKIGARFSRRYASPVYPTVLIHWIRYCTRSLIWTRSHISQLCCGVLTTCCGFVLYIYWLKCCCSTVEYTSIKSFNITYLLGLLFFALDSI